MRVIERPPHDLAGDDPFNAFVEHRERVVRPRDRDCKQQYDEDGWQQTEDPFHCLLLLLGCALSGLRFQRLAGSVVLKIGSRLWPGRSGKSVVPRTSLNPSSPGSFEVVVPLLKKSLLLVSHSQCWTRWPAASSYLARRNA